MSLEDVMTREGQVAKEHTIQDTIEEMRAVREAQSAGSWRLIIPGDSPPNVYTAEPHFVRYSEQHDYDLMVPNEYKTEQKARLALALMTRPGRLSYTEQQELLALLEE